MEGRHVLVGNVVCDSHAKSGTGSACAVGIDGGDDFAVVEYGHILIIAGDSDGDAGGGHDAHVVEVYVQGHGLAEIGLVVVVVGGHQVCHQQIGSGAGQYLHSSDVGDFIEGRDGEGEVHRFGGDHLQRQDQDTGGIDCCAAVEGAIGVEGYSGSGSSFHLEAVHAYEQDGFIVGGERFRGLGAHHDGGVAEDVPGFVHTDAI